MRWALGVVFLLHVAITGWAAFHHEAWVDETDTWLLVRDADVSTIVRVAAHRGAPLLFEATLWPFARAGAPYFVQQLLNLVWVWLAVLLVLRARELPLLLRVLFPFSYYPAFEYAVNARPYGLQMLLTFAMAAAWQEREEKPIRLAVAIALLANTTVHGLVTAAIAGLVLLLEQRRVSRQTVVMLLGGILAAAQLWPRGGPGRSPNIPQLETVWYALSSAFFADARPGDAIVPALAVLALVTFAISRSWPALLFFWSTAGALMLINVFLWMGGLRHAGILLLVTVAAVWLARAYGPWRGGLWVTGALAVALTYSMFPAARAWDDEARYAYSGSRELAEFLRSSGLDRAELVAHPVPSFSSFLVYLPEKKLWYPAAEAYGTYPRWRLEDGKQSRLPLAAALERAETQLRGRRWVFVTVHRLPPELRERYRLLYETRTPVWRAHVERFRVYEPLVSRSGI
ncbi:MAG TPA: hypothetical protein VGF28_16135 [Thermoanaerobaculia bacterium]|jgi:hypothetical protein